MELRTSTEIRPRHQVVNIGYKPFDASDWPLRESGLLGPVRLIPLKTIDPAAKTESKPAVFFIGDSTVRNVTTPGQSGWGEPLIALFDAAKINPVNRALGGRSSRTFITEGLWDNVLAELKPGDFVLMQFGHNDGGSLYQGRARASLKGIGDQTEDVILEASENPKRPHLRLVSAPLHRDAKAKGAVPSSCRWSRAHLERNKTHLPAPVRITADGPKKPHGTKAYSSSTCTRFVTRHYESVGEQTVEPSIFGQDHTHTTPPAPPSPPACWPTPSEHCPAAPGITSNR